MLMQETCEIDEAIKSFDLKDRDRIDRLDRWIGGLTDRQIDE